MHIYFSGIGGTGIGPLALIAKKAGYSVSGSDKQDSDYISYLKQHGIADIHIGQSADQIASVHNKNPIDWFVHSSAVSIENPNAPELLFCRENNIKLSKRDELINKILSDKNLKLIAVAGTHGKTTTTAMLIWMFKQLSIPISYSLGAKISYGDMGEYAETSEFFIYEADEFDRNFLQFKPFLSVIPGLAYDHPDIFPTVDDYNQAFVDFINQSENVLAHPEDLSRIGLESISAADGLENKISLPGLVNRKNASLVICAMQSICDETENELIYIINQFPGVSRRFERIIDNLYSDYAHTPEKISGALQLAKEVAGDNLVVVYEGLHNTRQHFIKDKLNPLFSGIDKIYVVPSYLAREDENLELLTPEKLSVIIKSSNQVISSQLDNNLKNSLQQDLKGGKLILCLTAGGGNSLDEWLRKEFK